jgi:hypothetical protein
MAKKKIDSTPKKDTFSMKQLKKKFNITAAYLATDESLQKAFKEIISKGITDPTRMQRIIENTDWWKNYTNDYRQYMQVKQTNPAEFAKNLNDAKNTLLSQAQSMGIDIDDAEAERLADLMLQGASKKNADGTFTFYDEKWLRQQFASMIDFSQTKTIGGITFTDYDGELANLADSIYKTAADYGIDSTMNNQAFTNWMQAAMKGVVAGTMTQQDVDEAIRDMAISNFPGLANQIMQGFTVRQAAASQLNAIANELELDPNTMSLNDNLVMQVLNTRDAGGNMVPMTAFEARKAARKDSRWQFTQNATTEYSSIAGKILEDFGFGA